MTQNAPDAGRPGRTRPTHANRRPDRPDGQADATPRERRSPPTLSRDIGDAVDIRPTIMMTGGDRASVTVDAGQGRRDRTSDHKPRRFGIASILVPVLLVATLGLGPAQAAVTIPAPAPGAASTQADAGKTDPGKTGAGKADSGKADSGKTGAAPALPGDDSPLDSRVVEELTRRKATLDRRERDLALRESQLAAAEALARREIASLTRLRGEVERMLSQGTAGADQDLALLAALYSNMKPAQAAAILAKLDVPKAAAILRRLDTRLAGPVLASMDPDIAAAITRELERHRAAFRQ